VCDASANTLINACPSDVVQSARLAFQKRPRDIIRIRFGRVFSASHPRFPKVVATPDDESRGIGEHRQGDRTPDCVVAKRKTNAFAEVRTMLYCSCRGIFGEAYGKKCADRRLGCVRGVPHALNDRPKEAKGSLDRSPLVKHRNAYY
jgi:hypothetical protein